MAPIAKLNYFNYLIYCQKLNRHYKKEKGKEIKRKKTKVNQNKNSELTTTLTCVKYLSTFNE